MNRRSTLLDLGGRAVNDDIVPLRAHADAELRLEVLEVLVVGAEERFDPVFGKRDSCHVYLVYLPYFNPCRVKPCVAGSLLRLAIWICSSRSCFSRYRRRRAHQAGLPRSASSETR